MDKKKKKLKKVHYRHTRKMGLRERIRYERDQYRNSRPGSGFENNPRKDRTSTPSTPSAHADGKTGVPSVSPRKRRSGRNNRRHNKEQSAAVRRKHRIIFILTGIAAILILSLGILYIHSHPERISSDDYTHAAQFEEDLAVDGIDVSYAQGDGAEIDWDSVKQSGVDFVFVRAGYSASDTGEIHEDDEFEENIQGAKEAGLMVGAYFYSQATSVKEAQAEARKLLEFVRDYEIDLPLVMDYEIYDGGRLDKYIAKDSYTEAKGTKIVLAFCKVIQDAGYEPAVYANYLMLTQNLKAAQIAKSAVVWMASYDTSTSYPYDYSYWQCSFEEAVNGISSEVDKDFWYFDPDGMTTRGARAEGATSIQDCTIELEQKDYRYYGWNVEPEVTVYDGDQELTEGTDYQLNYIHNTAPGTGYAVITGLGKYKDIAAKEFTIKEFL